MSTPIHSLHKPLNNIYNKLQYQMLDNPVLHNGHSNKRLRTFLNIFGEFKKKSKYSQIKNGS